MIKISKNIGVRIALITSLILLISACNRKFELPSWNADTIFPIAKISLGIHDIIQSELLQSDSNQLLKVVVNNEKFELVLDTLSTIPDTTIVQSIDSTSIDFLILTPGSSLQIKSNEKTILAPKEDIQLKQMDLNSGSLMLTLYSTLQEDIIIDYVINSATKDGTALQLSETVPAGSINNPSSISVAIDLTGYQLDLTGLGNSYNTIISNAYATLPSTANTIDPTINDYLKIEYQLIDLKPAYIKGYFVSTAFEVSETFDVFQNLSSEVSGNFSLKQMELDLSIANYLGVDLQTEITSITSNNNVESVHLNHSILNQTTNMSRATDKNGSSSPSNYSFNFNNNNSNISELVGIVPNNFSFDINFGLNPFGNSSLSNDFAYLNRGLDITMDLIAPIEIGFNNLTLSDTTPFVISDSIPLQINNGTINLIVNNGFPLEIDAKIILFDENFNRIDSIAFQESIAPASYSLVNYSVINPKQSILKQPIDSEMLNQWYPAKNAIVEMKLNTEDYPQQYPIYSYYKIDAQIVADINQTINSK